MTNDCNVTVEAGFGAANCYAAGQQVKIRPGARKNWMKGKYLCKEGFNHIVATVSPRLLMEQQWWVKDADIKAV